MSFREKEKFLISNLVWTQKIQGNLEKISTTTTVGSIKCSALSNTIDFKVHTTLRIIPLRLKTRGDGNGHARILG
jgi:hypothetical protein